MGKMKNLMADEWDRAYRQGYDDALAEHLGCLSQILDSPAPSAVQTQQPCADTDEHLPDGTGYNSGYAAALDAAEQALLKVEADMSNWSSDETRSAISAMPGLTGRDWAWAQMGVVRSGLIIRALQSEQQPSELQGKP